ncbi:hypothetical protein C2W62_37365 [Candidatus Entotheonella serta]|nr:hypothetical protein C2W62_37365 [Candidatus Entotheonella serta]
MVLTDVQDAFGQPRISSDMRATAHIDRPSRMDSQPSSNSALDDQRVPELDATQVLELFRAEISRELDMDFVEVPTNQPLAEIGMDSVTGVAYRAAIARRLGADFPASFLYEYPTLADQAAHILREASEGLLHAETRSGRLPPPPPQPHSPPQEPLTRLQAAMRTTERLLDDD